jgi:hypothetical protein
MHCGKSLPTIHENLYVVKKLARNFFFKFGMLLQLKAEETDVLPFLPF